jgi:hypothetical protein
MKTKQKIKLKMKLDCFSLDASLLSAFFIEISYYYNKID